MKTAFIKGAFAAVAASFALSAAPFAQAGVLTGSGISGEAVTITYNGAATATTAGVFTGTFDADGAGPIPVVNNILLWCIDIFQRVSNPFSYPDYTAAIYQSAPLTFSAARQQDLARLFANNYGTALSDAQHKAAFQLAIWDILFDTDANLLTAGAVGFGATGNAATIALAQTYITGLGTGTPSLLAVQFTSPDHQDFITPGLIPGVNCVTCQVPEPSPLPLLVIGAAGMLFAMRRRIAVPHRR